LSECGALGKITLLLDGVSHADLLSAACEEGDLRFVKKLLRPGLSLLRFDW
jgi:hypothetical protein